MPTISVLLLLVLTSNDFAPSIVKNIIDQESWEINFRKYYTFRNCIIIVFDIMFYIIYGIIFAFVDKIEKYNVRNFVWIHKNILIIVYSNTVSTQNKPIISKHVLCYLNRNFYGACINVLVTITLYLLCWFIFFSSLAK